MTVASTSILIAFVSAFSIPLHAQAAPEIFSPGVISGTANDLSPAFTPDGQTVVFTRANSEQSTIMISHLTGGAWSKPEIASFSGEWRDLEPAMAVDGSYLIFASNRPASGNGEPLDGHYNNDVQTGRGGNLWRVDRTSSGWGAPHRLSDTINANSSIFSPSVVADGSLYFMKPSGAKGRFHIFRAQLSHGEYATPVPVPVSAADSVGDFDPAVAPDESFMVFSSGRMPKNGTSLFIAMQKDHAWGAPTYMGTEVSPPNTGNIEARLGADHHNLYFSSTRVVPTAPHDRAASEKGLELMAKWNNGLANIWRVSLDQWIGATASR
jgi:Tol biopolymer transport system component